MFVAPSRRQFLQSAAASVAAAGGLSFLNSLPRATADDARPGPEGVRLRPEIEPLVNLIEETPRDKLIESVAEKLRSGTSYREILAALLLVGVKNVQPRPSVGFKFHAVLVVNSAHLASLASPDEHRWLPIFWALDHFKSSQARDESEGNWTMGRVDESALPAPHKAPEAFLTAMESWDEPAADAAVAQLARGRGLSEIYEMFFRLGARDYRSIGHKAIFVANSWRTLQCIGRQHAEPVLRSLAYALLNHDGDNPAKSDDVADRPWRNNQSRVKKINADWLAGKTDDAATAEMMATLREGSFDDSSEKVVELLNKGISPQSIWDGLFLAAGELLVRQNGIVALHALTTTNALHFAYSASASDETRRLMLLQNAAFLPMFREAMKGRGGVGDFRIDEFAPGPQDREVAATDVLSAISRDKRDAAQLTLNYAAAGGSARELIDAARVLVFLKGDDAHDYKFSSAVLEDYYHISPAWRDRYLAGSVYQLHGSGERDNPLVTRIRSALA